MGTVKYKFEYNPNIDDPLEITFGTKSARLIEDKKEGYLIEGKVENVDLEADGQLHIFARTSGRIGQTWSLSVEYNTKKLVDYPINRSFVKKTRLTMTEDFKVTA